MGPQKGEGTLQRLAELCKSPFHWKVTDLLPHSRLVGQTFWADKEPSRPFKRVAALCPRYLYMKTT